MSTVLRYSDNYASYELSLEGQIICAVVAGAIGDSFSRRYNNDFRLLMDQLSPGAWGHFGDFRNCEALSKEAQQASKSLHEEAKNKGCIVSAFQMDSALLKSQVNSIRVDKELPVLASQRFFATKSAALAFIEVFLSSA
tara:strand:+ start:69 stop:485 length:417 start_codon:yes stop_codon:yes gene_type:complete